MAATKKTLIFCLDDYHTFAEDIRKRFSDRSRYEVLVFYNESDLINAFTVKKSLKTCSMVIIGLHDNKENYQNAENFIDTIRKMEPDSGILLIVSPERMDDARKHFRFNIDNFIPRNSNTVLRVHNAVKKHISEHNLRIYRKKRNISLIILAAFLIFSLFVLVFARLKFPHYF